MNKRRILIVDDDPDILFLLAHSIKRIDPSFEVLTATNGLSALAEAEKNPFDLILTDHMMPEMTGLELAEKIHHCCPETPIVLMTAYETQRLGDNLTPYHLRALLRKPFKIPDVLVMVRQHIDGQDDGALSGAKTIDLLAKDDAVSEQLRTLWNETSAHTVLLLNADGELVQAVGAADPATLSRLATFVADNFLAVTELASLLNDNESSFKSSYHEGTRYNIYAHSINARYSLAVTFPSDKRPGPIWIYTRQTAEAIAELAG